jgi:hypothetical protein
MPTNNRQSIIRALSSRVVPSDGVLSPPAKKILISFRALPKGALL